MSALTKEQAIALAESKFWEPLSFRERALQAELRGERPPMTWDEIIQLIPAEKRLVVSL